MRQKQNEIQDGIAQEILEILTSLGSHAYFQGPTGTGKSWTIMKTSERLPSQYDNCMRIILVGRANITSQFQTDFDNGDYDNIIKDKDKSLYWFDTWQGLNNLCNRYNNGIASDEDIERIDRYKNCFLILDEAHLGSSNENVNSIPNIIQTLDPTFKLYVSATLKNAQEAILGEKKDHMVILTTEKAYENGLLCPLTFVRYEMGTILSISDIRNVNEYLTKTNQSIDDIIGSTAEEVVEKVKDIDDGAMIIEAAQKIIHHRLISLRDIYLTKHHTEQAIFFVPNIEYADWFADKINSAYRKKTKKSAPIAVAVHSQADQTEQLIKDFKSGKQQVVVVVGMLREGFDHPSLSLIFDGAFNPNNPSSAIQKIGRILRIDPNNKNKHSLYYYGIDPKYYFPGNGNKTISDAFKAEGDLCDNSDETLELQRNAAAMVAEITAAEIGIDSSSDFEDRNTKLPHQTTNVVNENVELYGDENDYELDLDKLGEKPSKSIKLAETPFYQIDDVDGCIHHSNMAFNDVFVKERDSKSKKQQLFEMAKNGEPRPKSRSSLGSSLCNYTNKHSCIYDKVFDEEIRILRADWFISKDKSKENKIEIINMAKNGESRPLSKTHLGSALISYIRIKSNSYDKAFDEEIRILRPDWFANSTNETKKILLEMAKNGEPRPTKLTFNGRGLISYTNISHISSYDKAFDEEIRILRPDWFANSANETKKILLEMAKNGEPRPMHNTFLGKSFRRYVSKTHGCYDENFEKLVRTIRTDWFLSKTDEYKNILLEMAKNGKPRPRKTTLLGRALVNYTSETRKGYGYDEDFDNLIRKYWTF